MDDINPNSINKILMQFGINIGFIVSGFFGALLLISKNSAARLTTTMISIVSGMACANYLTPVIIKTSPSLGSLGVEYGLAFVMGFAGLKGVESFIENVLNIRVIKNTQKPTRRVK